MTQIIRTRFHGEAINANGLRLLGNNLIGNKIFRVVFEFTIAWIRFCGTRS